MACPRNRSHVAQTSPCPTLADKRVLCRAAVCSQDTAGSAAAIPASLAARPDSFLANGMEAREMRATSQWHPHFPALRWSAELLGSLLNHTGTDKALGAAEQQDGRSPGPWRCHRNHLTPSPTLDSLTGVGTKFCLVYDVTTVGLCDTQQNPSPKHHAPFLSSQARKPLLMKGRQGAPGPARPPGAPRAPLSSVPLALDVPTLATAGEAQCHPAWCVCCTRGQVPSPCACPVGLPTHLAGPSTSQPCFKSCQRQEAQGPAVRSHLDPGSHPVTVPAALSTGRCAQGRPHTLRNRCKMTVSDV